MNTIQKAVALQHIIEAAAALSADAATQLKQSTDTPPNNSPIPAAEFCNYMIGGAMHALPKLEAAVEALRTALTLHRVA